MPDPFTLFSEVPGKVKRPLASSRFAWMRGLYVRNQ